MKYVGIQTQKSMNNRKSILLLFLFPLILLVLTYALILSLAYLQVWSESDEYHPAPPLDFGIVNQVFVSIAPFVVVGVAIWFIIAYFFNAKMVQLATGAHSVTRKENPRIYNIVENLCMTCGMDMPKINVVDDPQLNAFASGINKNSYTVTVTTGICERLTDEELKGVVAHELTHIRNNDTKLLITSIIFVGIISTLINLFARTVMRIGFDDGTWSSTSSRRSNLSGGSDKDRKGCTTIVLAIVIVFILLSIAYIFTSMTRFAISRKREFMADAGGAELCGNPLALASALRKISDEPGLDNVSRPDMAQLFICRPDEMKEGFLESSFNNLFSTHPDTKERIRILEQF